MIAVARKRLARLRLASQCMTTERFSTPADVVRWMTAMQAQDFAGAKWSVGLRLPGSTEADVESALAAGTIVRSWPMRGTLHFVTAEDLGWMLDLTADRLVAGATSRRAALGLDDVQLERARDASREALAGGRVLTRDQMQEVFERAGVSPHGQRGYFVLRYLSLTGTLCFGPPRSKQQNFVLLDEWVRSPRRLEHDEALGELARRYFLSRGPATIKDFAWWSSLTTTDARRGLAVASTELAELEVDDTRYYLSPEADATPGAGGTRALPGFDEYLLGYQDRSAQLAPERARMVVPGSNGMFMPTIVHDGIVVGTWKRSITPRAVRVEALPFAALSARAEAGFARASAEYSAFLGLPAAD